MDLLFIPLITCLVKAFYCLRAGSPFLEGTFAKISPFNSNLRTQKITSYYFRQKAKHADKKSMKLFIFLSLILLLSSCGPKYTKEALPLPWKKVKSILKLGLQNEWSFRIDGEWLFYWKHFVPIKDVLENKLPKEKHSYIKRGELWDSQLNLPGEGYGTLIMKIKNLKKLES